MEGAHAFRRALRPWRRIGVVSAATSAAGVATLSHLSTYGSCRQIATSVGGRPYPGTPAAAYCNAVWHCYDWLAFALAGACVGGLVYAAMRPFAPWTRFGWSIGLLVALAIAHLAVVSGLRNYFGA